jgi:phytoene synthase
MTLSNPAINTPNLLSEATDVELRQAWQNCAKIARRVAHNFFYAFLFLPRENRNGIYALYAFCRAGDDAADDGYQNPTAMINALKQKLTICYDGYYVDDVTLALSATIKRFQLPREHFDDLFLGLEEDISGTQIASFADLKLYCYRVAVTVGLLCLYIFECDDATSRRYAEYIGFGMQLTNILRDIEEDYEHNRIYLPPEDIDQFGLNQDNLLEACNSNKLHALIKWEGERARELFKAANMLYADKLPPKLRVAGIMAAFYHEILNLVIKGDRKNGQVTLTRRQKLSIAYKAISA